MESPSSNSSSHVPTAPYSPPPKQSRGAAIASRRHRIMHTITHNWGRTLKIVLAVAVGLGIAIAIAAAGEGIDKEINRLLGRHDSSDLKRLGVDIPAIRSVLSDVQDLLIWLATGYTVASVGMVMWASLPQRRQEVSNDIQEGQTRRAIWIELGVEALILCVAGGLAGIFLGFLLCDLTGRWKPSLPLSLSFRGVITVFPSMVGATYAVAIVMAGLLSTIFRDPDR